MATVFGKPISPQRRARRDLRGRFWHGSEVPRDLLPIGSFAARCRLSVKALRHYDELGLLRPRHVDLTSGYRYYDRRQASAAIAIALLRSLDVPLATIRELLAGEDPEAVSRVLARERERRAREIAQ